jgi:hypothetical protein
MTFKRYMPTESLASLTVRMMTTLLSWPSFSDTCGLCSQVAWLRQPPLSAALHAVLSDRWCHKKVQGSRLSTVAALTATPSLAPRTLSTRTVRENLLS